MGIENGKIIVKFKTGRWGTKIDFMLILGAISISCLSLLIDMKVPEYYLFARSGSIMVLIGAVLEVRQVKYQEAYNKEFQAVLLREGIISPIQPERLKGVYSLIRNTTHLLILTGTFIWGYGDLPFKC